MTPVWHTAAGAVGARRRKAHRKERIGLQQRAIGVGDLVRAAVQDIECVELNAPAIGEAIADRAVQQTGGRRRRKAPSSVSGRGPK